MFLTTRRSLAYVMHPIGMIIISLCNTNDCHSTGHVQTVASYFPKRNSARVVSHQYCGLNMNLINMLPKWNLITSTLPSHLLRNSSTCNITSRPHGIWWHGGNTTLKNLDRRESGQLHPVWALKWCWRDPPAPLMEVVSGLSSHFRNWAFPFLLRADLSILVCSVTVSVDGIYCHHSSFMYFRRN
jgi:hypothetical protein